MQQDNAAASGCTIVCDVCRTCTKCWVDWCVQSLNTETDQLCGLWCFTWAGSCKPCICYHHIYVLLMLRTGYIQTLRRQVFRFSVLLLWTWYIWQKQPLGFRDQLIDLKITCLVKTFLKQISRFDSFTQLSSMNQHFNLLTREQKRLFPDFTVGLIPNQWHKSWIVVHVCKIYHNTCDCHRASLCLYGTLMTSLWKTICGTRIYIYLNYDP